MELRQELARQELQPCNRIKYGEKSTYRHLGQRPGKAKINQSKALILGGREVNGGKARRQH